MQDLRIIGINLQELVSLLTRPPEEREALAKVDGYSSDKSTRRQDGALPEYGSPCAPRLL